MGMADDDVVNASGPGVLLDPVEVGRVLGIPTATLANWRCAGTGPPFLRVGRHVRYRHGDLDAWIDARVRTPGRQSVESHGR